MAGGMKLQDAATTGNGNEVDMRGQSGAYMLTVVGTGTVSTGAVQWETAPTSGYSGTWSPLGQAITVVSGEVKQQQFTGPLHKVRARLSTSVTGGGSVTVHMQPPRVGNED